MKQQEPKSPRTATSKAALMLWTMSSTDLFLLSTVKNNIQNIKICLDKPNMMMTTWDGHKLPKSQATAKEIASRVNCWVDRALIKTKCRWRFIVRVQSNSGAGFLNFCQTSDIMQHCSQTGKLAVPNPFADSQFPGAMFPGTALILVHKQAPCTPKTKNA